MANFQTIRETEGGWTGPEMALIHGVRMPAVLVDPNLHEDLERFQTRRDDVFIGSYPRSGTTWMRELLWQIYNDGAISDVHLGSRVLWLEIHPLLHRREPDNAESSPVSKPVIDLLPSPRLLWSHLPYQLIPKGKDDATTCKYIYIARNPKDVAVSLYYFLFSIDAESYSGLTWDIFLKFFLQGKLVYNLWSDHVLEWWKHRDDPNILFLKYEDLKKDLLSNVRTIAEFLEKPLSEDVIQRIAHQCSFHEMAKTPVTFQVFPDVDASYLRKGEVGDWKNHFTLEVNEKFEAEFLAKAREHGLEFE
ncbi:hypothetical protein ACROYT_G034042 [Oculina patagonica]